MNSSKDRKKQYADGPLVRQQLLRVNHQRALRCHGAGLVQSILDHWKPLRDDNRQSTHTYVRLITNWFLFMQEHQVERMRDGEEMADAVFEILIAYEAWFCGQGKVWKHYVEDSKKALEDFDEAKAITSVSGEITSPTNGGGSIN